MAMVHVQDGKSCFFWIDLCNKRALHQDYPELFSFAKDAYISFHNVQSTAILHSPFHLPLSDEAYIQFQELGGLVRNINIQQHADQWS